MLLQLNLGLPYIMSGESAPPPDPGNAGEATGLLLAITYSG